MAVKQHPGKRKAINQHGQQYEGGVLVSELARGCMWCVRRRVLAFLCVCVLVAAAFAGENCSHTYVYFVYARVSSR